MKERTSKKRKNTSVKLAWIFGILSLILTACAVCAVVVAVKLQRNNMFSRSIMIDNNYFMKSSVTDSDNLSSFDENNSSTDVYVDSSSESWYSFWEIAIETAEYIKGTYSIDITVSTETMDRITWLYQNYGVTSEADRAVENYLYEVLGERIDLSGVRESESVILDVPYLSQEGILPNGCEAVSATMLLNYFGFDISPETFVDGYLEMKPVSIRWGCRYGPNPKYYYAGDPRSEKEGWGCFAPVIERALNKYLPDGYTAKNTTGLSLNTLKEKYISNGIPVAVWVTVNMEEVSRILQWQSEDGDETFLYPANEHCMVFIGYDSENYIFADPYESNGTVTYPVEACVLAYNSMGMQSVAVISE